MIDLFFISFLIQKITKHKTRKTKHGINICCISFQTCNSGKRQEKHF